MQLWGGVVLLGEVVPERAEKRMGCGVEGAGFVGGCVPCPLHVGFFRFSPVWGIEFNASRY